MLWKGSKLGENDLCFHICLTALWRMVVRDERSCCVGIHRSHHWQKMAAGFRVGQGGWREVEKPGSDVNGMDRKKMAVRREIYIWKSHQNINTRPTVQMKISSQQLSGNHPDL